MAWRNQGGDQSLYDDEVIGRGHSRLVWMWWQQSCDGVVDREYYEC